MIDFSAIHQKFNILDLKKYAGVRYQFEKCIGEGLCRRDGDHKDHTWYDEVLISDEILLAGGKGQLDKKVWLPIRWYNFTLAVYKVMNGRKILKNDFEIATEAIKWAKDNCFDPSGAPNNMATKYEFTSYGKLLDQISENTIKN